MNDAFTYVAKKTSLYIFLGLLAYMPLHILLSTWIGTSTNTLELAKVAKDGVLVVGFFFTLALSMSQKWFKGLLKDRLLWLILAYAGLTILLAIFKPTDTDAEVLGVVYNTRFLLFLLYGVLLTHLFPDFYLKNLAVKIVLIAGGIVALFGIIQYLFLPNDILIHLGYTRDNGVLPAFFIDDKPDLERVMSTLRDPNSLGSYLIIVAMVASGALLAARRKSRTILLTTLLVTSVVCLWFTFSRSGVVGFALAALTLIALSDDKFKRALVRHRKTIIVTCLFVVVALSGGLYTARDTYLVQNVILHSDKSTTLEDPNQLRIRYFKESVGNIADEPGGTGPGTAGLASIHNNVQGTVLNENYYLQIGTEIGIIGLLLFIGILGVVALRLYHLRGSTLALALLAGFVGLGFTNMLIHVWSNEAVAYTWWGLAGLALAHQLPPARTKTAKPVGVGRKIPSQN